MYPLIDRLGLQWNDSLLFPTCNGAPFYQNSSFNLERKASVDASVLGRGKKLGSNILSAIDKECINLYNQIVETITI